MKKYPLVGKCLAVGIILLFIGTSIIPSSGQKTEKPSLPISRGNTLYVGGSGPGNYTRIQDAINASSDGDTIFVYSGIYYESINIPHAIRLMGQSKNTTIIHEKQLNQRELIVIDSDGVSIAGFKLETDNTSSIIANHGYWNGENITISGNIFKSKNSTAIDLYGMENCHIAGNSFFVNGNVLMLSQGRNIIVTNNSLICDGVSVLADYVSIIFKNNIIKNSEEGIRLSDSDFSEISHNSFSNITYYAIEVNTCRNTNISFNLIDNSPRSVQSILLRRDTAIQLSDVEPANITHNLIRGYQFGIYLDHSFEVLVAENTFEKNIVNARFINTYSFYNKWEKNYWGRPRILPKPIIGIKYTYKVYPGFVEFDWHPAQKPYNIPLTS